MGMRDDGADVHGDFVEAVGLIAQGEGLPRVAGRIFGLLILGGERLSRADLARRLDASPAGVAAGLRVLEDMRVVWRMPSAGTEDHFQVAEDAFAILIETWVQRARRAGAEIEGFGHRLPADDPEACRRLEAYAAFYHVVAGALDGIEARLPPLPGAPRRPGRPPA